MGERRLYNLLQVNSAATQEEISRSYKKLALKYHPDKTNTNPELTEKFKDITKAYEILRDSKSRAIYDNYGEKGLDGSIDLNYEKPQHESHWYHNQGGPMAKGQDIFSQMFGSHQSFANSAFSGMGAQIHMDMFNMMSGMYGMGATHPSSSGQFTKRTQPVPKETKIVQGEDIHHTCNVTLKELYLGKIIRLRLPKNCKCTNCDGYGGSNPKTCRTCEGYGQVMITMFNHNSQYQEFSSCRDCRGTGVFITPQNICAFCNGEGYREENKIIQAKVYPGSKNNDKIVLSGEGDEGRNMIPGDLIITLKEIADSNIVRRGDDLFIEKDIDLRTAILGGSLTIKDFIYEGNHIEIMINTHGVQTINHETNEFINKGEVLGIINNSSPKRIRGLGMPINTKTSNGKSIQTNEDIKIQNNGENDSSYFDLKKIRRGNLYIKFNVIMPKLSDFTADNLSLLNKVLPKSELESSVANKSGVKRKYLENISGAVDSELKKENEPKKIKIDQKDSEEVEVEEEDDDDEDGPSYSDIDFKYSDDDPEKEDQEFYENQWVEGDDDGQCDNTGSRNTKRKHKSKR